MRYKYLLSFVLAFICSSQVFAQSYSVKGKITDGKDNSALPGATVFFIHLPDSVKVASVTNLEGQFNFQVKAGEYLLRVSFLGFQTLQRSVQVTNKPLDLGNIGLEVNSKMLHEVTITESVLTAVQKGDTTEFNAQAFKTNPDANADELVEKIPGVIIQDGKVKAQGEDVKRVLVDGKEFFGDDAMATLKNLPAEVIDKIQVFDEQSERARISGIDDGILNKTINIITKPEKRNGRFGKGSVGGGTDNRYVAGGVLNIFKPGRRLTIVGESNNINQQNFGLDDLLGAGTKGGQNSGSNRNADNGTTTTHAAGLNYLQSWSKKAELTASYYGSYTDNTGFENSFREYIERRAIDTELEQETYAKQNSNHRVNARFEYQIDSANTLFIQPRLSFQMNKSLSDFNSQSFLKEAPVNAADNTTSADLAGYNLNNELIFRHRFPKKGRTASISLHTSATKNAGDNFLNGLTTIYRDTLTRYNRRDQLRNRNTNGYNINTNITYTEPLQHAGYLSFNYTIGFNKNDSDRRTYNRLGDEEDYWDLSERLSNTFVNNGSLHQVGLGYHYFTKKLNLTVRASYQYSDLNNDRIFPTQRNSYKEFTKFVPNASLVYRFSKQKNVRFTYSSTTSNPSIDQLQDFVDNINTLRLRTGNPDLQQEYRHNFNFRYSALNLDKSSTFVANVSGNVVQNSIATNRIINAARDTIEAYNIKIGPSVQLTRPVNLAGQYSIRSFINYGLPIKPIKSNLNFDLSADYNREPGMSNDTANFSITQDYNLGITISSNISENIDFTITSRSSYNLTHNTFRPDLNNTYFTQVNRIRLNWIFLNNFYLNTTFSQRIINGLNVGFNQNREMWHVSLGRKVFRNNSGDIRLSVFDALKENSSIRRNINTIYIEDVQNQVLQRYYMLSFTYTLRRFGKKDIGLIKKSKNLTNKKLIKGEVKGKKGGNKVRNLKQNF